ncbi:hypothetical protein [Paraglaciecola marina]|uniref:hypothetical protein n=1 Tax=Paraglaciecola marina TaxID=2500157 RepID=UPI00105E8D7D|nr:hypothetical protein [Paraglaciecola marina]
MQLKVDKLTTYFDQFESFSIAVSGGIDSMLLAYLANRFSKAKVKSVHAFSPAVPQAAFQRVKHYAQVYSWDLEVINAGEFDDDNYLNNPVNRCYYCKSNLYTRIAECSQGMVFSGTNLDDLDDYRPGLEAAKEQNVQHPYVATNINKSDIYAIAKFYGLSDIHALPAQPCLASRVETGIKIDAGDLGFINQVEESTRQALPEVKNVRCRITQQGTYLEIDTMPDSEVLEQLSDRLATLCAQDGRVFSGIRSYQKGSAFINGVTHG